MKTMAESINTDRPAYSNERLNAALEYADMGFSVIPVNKNDKKPYIKWTEFQKRIPTPSEIETWWQQWPEANVAIITGKISGIFCVDADGPIGIQWMVDNLPKTSVYSKTKKGVHAIFKIPDDCIIRNLVRLTTEVDIRGEGGYFVAPPSTHSSGHKYEFQFLLGGWDDLSEYAPPTAGKGNINADLSTLKNPTILAPVVKGSRNSTLTQLIGKWIGNGLDNEEILILCRSWNADNSPPLADVELKTTLESVRKTHIKNHPEIDTTNLIIDTEASTETIFPQHLLVPDGMISEIMDWIYSSSAVSLKEFNLAGAIAMMGTLIGQRFETETRLKTNFYVMALGHAGSGKDSPQDAIPSILLQTTESNCIGPPTLTSDAALLKYISNQTKARTIIFLDEIGLMLKSIKRPNSAGYEIQSTLMKLFSSVNRSFYKPYANGEDLLIRWHHVSLYGASTPTHFWQSFTRSDATDGFLARVLIFESHQKRVMSRRDINLEAPKNLIKQINEFSKFCPIPEENEGKNLTWKPKAIRIPKTQKADKYFLDWEQSIIDKQNAIQEKDEGVAAIYGRAAEHAHKLALTHAISLYGPKLKNVDMESVQWAIDLMEHQTAHMIDRIRNNISENDWHQHQQRIIKAIKRYSTPARPGASIRDIYRFGIRVPEKIMNDLLHSLQASGEILKQIHKPARGKNVDIYAIAKDEKCQ